MRRLATLTVAVLLAVAAFPGSFAHAQEGGDEAELRIDTADVGEDRDVRLSLSVPTTQGELPDNAFTVREDGEVQQAEVEYLASQDLQILLLIDTTGSMGGAPMLGAQQAATSFVEQLPAGSDVAVMAYDAEPRLLTEFGDDAAAHVAAIEGLVPDGRTALYDAIVAATSAFPETENDATRVIVLLTDGEDNESASTLDAATAALTETGVTLHSVEYLTRFTDEAAVRQMAEAAGGSVLQAADAAELLDVYQQLAADLVSRYEIAYTSDGSGTVELTVDVRHEELTGSGSRQLVLPAPPPPPTPPRQEEPAPAPVVEPPTPDVLEVSGLARAALIVGATLWFLAMLTLMLVWVWPREQRSQLWGTASRAASKHGNVTEIANRASSMAEHALERRGYHSPLNRALERAGINLRPGEFVVLMLSAVVTAFALGFALSGWLAALALASLTLTGFRLGVSFLVKRRQARFADQLAETLQLLSGSLRAGYSFMQAIDAVAREADAPASEEFGRLVIETRLGRDVGDALNALAERMQSEDFVWVVQAIEIHRDVGGDLAEVLDTVAATIRERNQIRRQVKALSAEGRLSAYVLLALPFGVGGLMFFGNRSYLGELVTGGPLGWAMIGLGVVLMTVGVIWMRKLVRLEF